MNLRVHSLAITITLLSFWTVGSAHAQPRISPDEILKHVAQVGSRQAVHDYYDKPIWTAIEQGIMSGAPRWLEVYSALRPGTDGASAEDIGQAITNGIPSAPFRVLSVLHADHNGRMSYENLCTFDFEVNVPDGGAEAFLTRLQKALNSAGTSREKSIRDACLSGLADTRKTKTDHPPR